MPSARSGAAIAFLLFAAPVAATLSGCAREGAATEPREPISWFVADGDPEGGFRESDRELARWALEAWGRQADPPLELVAGPAETATIRVFWVSGRDGLYGEMRPRRIGEDRIGADVREAARQMLYGEVKRLFVEDDGRLVGVISQTDIAHAVGTGRLQPAVSRSGTRPWCAPLRSSPSS